MALDATTLATELKTIGFPAGESAAVDALADAWAAYWEESQADPGAVGANAAPAAAVTAFKAALAGVSDTGNSAADAAQLLFDACNAFWTAATPLLAFPTAPPPAAGAYTVAPPFIASGTWADGLGQVFLDNKGNSESASASYDAVSVAMDTGQAGAQFPDTTTPTPITYTVS